PATTDLPTPSLHDALPICEILHGEGILAITKALLEAGISYVGGYPGAPVSHMIDVLADANDVLLKPMGVYFEQSGSEAAAAALLDRKSTRLNSSHQIISYA